MNESGEHMNWAIRRTTTQALNTTTVHSPKSTTRTPTKIPQGFSLVELLVVVAILAILAAIAIPLFLSQREKAVRASLLSDARNVGTSLSSASKFYPPGSPQTVSWNLATQNIEIGNPTTETIPVAISGNTNLSIVGNTTNWCVSAENVNSGEREVYGTEGIGQCHVWNSYGAAKGVETNSWRSVAYGNGLFVAVSYTGSANRVMTSPNGINWTARGAANGVEANGWHGVTYGNGLFVAVAWSGNENRLMTSPDGETWTPRGTSNGVEILGWRAITYGNGRFVAVGVNSVMTSPDGITWSSHTSPTNDWSSVTYGDGKFVAVAFTGSANRVMTSPDGITWTVQPEGAGSNWTSVTHGDGKFVAVAYTGASKIMTSDDGETWAFPTATSAIQNSGWYAITYGNGLFVATAWNGADQVMTSEDGEMWTGRGSANGVGPGSWTAVAYGNGKFVSVAFGNNSNRAMASP